MSRAFNPTTTHTLAIFNGPPRTVPAEALGKFHIHATQTGFAVSPHKCGWQVGTFRNITIARRMAKALAFIPGVNWDGETPETIFPTEERRRASYDVVRAERIPQ